MVRHSFCIKPLPKFSLIYSPSFISLLRALTSSNYLILTPEDKSSEKPRCFHSAGPRIFTWRPTLQTNSTQKLHLSSHREALHVPINFLNPIPDIFSSPLGTRSSGPKSGLPLTKRASTARLFSYDNTNIV